MKIIKSLSCMIFILFFITIAATGTTFAETTENSSNFDVKEGDAHITAAVVIENGIARSLTEEEYLQLFEGSEVGEPIDNTNGAIEDMPIMPKTDYYYEFVGKSSSSNYENNLKRRVSTLFENATQVYVSNSLSFSREVVQTGGLTVTASHQNIIDASVELKYGYTKTAASSTNSTVVGVFTPTGNYRYSAIVFTPRIATVSGEYQFWQEWGGDYSILSRYNMVYKYPCVTSGGYLDGTYSLMESDSQSTFPN